MKDERRLRKEMKETKEMPRMEKTNVMRLLDKAGIPYEPFFYEPDPKLTGSQIAQILNEPPSKVFKTLVCVGKSKSFYAFLIPVNKELDLKLAAKAAEEKDIEMLPLKSLLPTTGYVHGGCSPLGMKKHMRHFIDLSAGDLDFIYFSGGKRGTQVKLKRDDALKVAELSVVPLVRKTA